MICGFLLTCTHVYGFLTQVRVQEITCSILLLAAICYFHLYSNSADLNFRYEVHPELEDGFWEFHRKYYAEGFRLWKLDHLGHHCPWSWERAKEYRLAHLRTYLGEGGRHNEKLGHLTAADCDDPAKQEWIARGAFVSRSRYWGDGMMQLLFAPISFVLLLALAIVVGVVEVILYAWDIVRGV